MMQRLCDKKLFRDPVKSIPCNPYSDSDDLLSDDELYTINVQKIKTFLLGIIVRLNKLNLEPFFGRGKNNIPVDVTSDIFRKKSIFFNEKMETKKFYLNSKTYRARFLSLLFVEVTRNADACIDIMMSLNDDSYINKPDLLSGLSDTLINFGIDFLKVKDYGNTLKMLCEILLLAKQKKSKRNYLIIEECSEQMKNFNHSYAGLEIEAEALESLLVMAFIVVMGVLPNANELCIEEFNQYNQEDVRGALELLGNAILQRIKSGKKVSHLYRIFRDSKPYLFYKFRDINTNTPLNAGCRALSYLAFIENENQLCKVTRSLCLA